MKIHLHQIPAGGFLHLEGEEDPSALGLEEGGAQPIGPLRYNLEAGLSEGGLFATGRLSQRVRLNCVSCLEPFEMELESGHFATQVELDGRESVDLTPEIREDIQLLLPPHPRCDSGGDKTCPAKFPESIQPPSAAKDAPPIWAALDKIKPQ